MDVLIEGFWQFCRLFGSDDEEIASVVWLTLKVSGTATLLSVAGGLPLGAWLAFSRFPGRQLLLSFVNFGMGLPPVVAGLLVSLLLWRSGPLGQLGLLYTPTAMLIAQVLLALPLVTGLSFAALAAVHDDYRLQLAALGAGRWQSWRLLCKEAWPGVLAAIIAGFGGVISEVGASMMVGGNIRGQTRVLTTATVMEVSKGNFPLAVAFSLLLLLLSYGIVAMLTFWQNQRRRR